MSQLREFLQPLLDQQEDHPVYPRLEVRWDLPFDLTSIPCRLGEREMRMTAKGIDEMLQERMRLIADERYDPYRYGYEPAVWHEADWRLAELRVRFPGEPVTLGVLGGNGSSKTWYMAKRFTQCMVENEDWLCWQLSEEEKTSRETPQRYVYRYLPVEFRSSSGKLKKTAQTKLTYNEANGFTDNTFSLPNQCRTNFMFYNGNIKALEGPRPNVVWADELIPKNWAETAKGRLITKAGLTHALVPKLKVALEVRREAMKKPLEERQAALDAAWYEHIKPIIPDLFQGVMVITFTPKEGYTPTVAMLLDEAATLVEVEAEILPKTVGGEVVGYEKVPRVQLNEEEKALVMYFHVYDNPFGGNWAGMKSLLAKRNREEKLWRAYGVATKTIGAQFPRFRREAHVRPPSWLPKVGTWYHIVDPCPGRNWFMTWLKVCPIPGSKELKFFAREWPQQGDWIEAGGVGEPGEWAVASESDKRYDGSPGPAQQPWGLGLRQYADEIRRVEKELLALERELHGPQVAGEEDGIRILEGCRIMDGRAGNAPTTTHGGSVTLIEAMEEYGLYFIPAGRDSGAEEGSTTIREGVVMINDACYYDEEDTEITDDGHYKFHGRAPTLMVAENCKNIIWALLNWTGKDGQKGACKDGADVVRYGIIANLEHIIPQLDLGGGSY